MGADAAALHRDERDVLQHASHAGTVHWQRVSAAGRSWRPVGAQGVYAAAKGRDGASPDRRTSVSVRPERQVEAAAIHKGSGLRALVRLYSVLV